MDMEKAGAQWWKLWRGLLALALSLGLASGVQAGPVYGVINAGGHDLSGRSAEVLSGTRVIDNIVFREGGQYQVYLPEGRYKVRLCLQGRYWEGDIQAYVRALRQDLELMNTGRQC